MAVLRHAAGSVVPITVTTREVRTDSSDGRKWQPLSVAVTGITNQAGTSVTPLPSVVVVEEGVSVVHWDTAGLAAGDYLVKVSILTNTDTAALVRPLLVRLLPVGAFT